MPAVAGTQFIVKQVRMAKVSPIPKDYVSGLKITLHHSVLIVLISIFTNSAIPMNCASQRLKREQNNFWIFERFSFHPSIGPKRQNYFQYE